MMKDDWTPGCDVKADVPDNQKGRHYDVFEELIMAAHLALVATILTSFLPILNKCLLRDSRPALV
jgi:hypothetical protein